MITDLLLKFGSAPGVQPVQIPITPITVFVGPNNSGKSKALAEIERFSTEGIASQNDVIVQNIRFQVLIPETATAAIANLTVNPRPNETETAGHIFVESNRGGRMQLQTSELLKVVQNPNAHAGAFARWFLKHFILKLDGPGRMGLVTPQRAGDLQARAVNSLQVIFRDEEKRKEVRRILHEAFASYFVIDPTNVGMLRIRFSPRGPINDMEERNIHAEGVAFHALGTPLELFSDGVKAFTGIVLELIAGDPRVLLIDEPEAFLHPSLASKLGYEIARAAVLTDKRIFVSTHSPQFVMGCIQSGAPINIVRLTYRFGGIHSV